MDLARAKQCGDQVLLASHDPDERPAALHMAQAIEATLAAQESGAQARKP
jgi:hypothetical protein